MNALQTEISFALAAFFFFVALILCYEKRRDIAIARQALVARLPQWYDERIDELCKDPEKRREVIEKKIERKKCAVENIISFHRKSNSSVCSGGTQCLDNSTSSSASVDDSERVPKYDLGHNENNENICSICLDTFRVGDEVSWSKDLRCHHCFHSDCLIAWLMKRGECPVCRSSFLCKEDFIIPDAKIDEKHNTKNETGDEEKGDCGTPFTADSSLSFEIRNGQVTLNSSVIGLMEKFPFSVP
jgi:hypothetical protein